MLFTLWALAYYHHDYYECYFVTSAIGTTCLQTLPFPSAESARASQAATSIPSGLRACHVLDLLLGSVIAIVQQVILSVWVLKIFPSAEVSCHFPEGFRVDVLVPVNMASVSYDFMVSPHDLGVILGDGLSKLVILASQQRAFINAPFAHMDLCKQGSVHWKRLSIVGTALFCGLFSGELQSTCSTSLFCRILSAAASEYRSIRPCGRESTSSGIVDAFPPSLNTVVAPGARSVLWPYVLA